MTIETTLHVHQSTLALLNRTAEVKGITRTFIIKLLMQRMMRDNKKMLKSSSRIKYQERDVKDNWHCIHFVMNEYEYEYYLDMRKFYKMSVSFILAYAVKKYINEIVEELFNGGKKTDNYIYRNYILMKKSVNETICWQIYWGIPLKLPRIISF
jgi:hypothetical protein